ncbi:hypothetical protein J1N35_004633 [Gossypium stocksii]|uniref:Uncharacterized protein n=1 Tax=Gossypium stocksii TaxID=47602 RepID=A0A9D4AI78_9ROSI|nr:hypothetical protein J1N35_004633 [Gossypium stocksii]
MDQERIIPAATSNSRRSQLLKESLSETFTLFYTLAGKIKGHLSIDCNDEGAYYVEARSVAYPREATFSALFSPFLKKGICRSMRIVFDASAIDLLKVKTASSSVRDPAQVEVVSALLCKCIMATFKAKSGIQKSTFITHAVNLRQRAVTQFSKHSMGNFL